MAYFGKRNISAEDISQAKEDEVENLIENSSPSRDVDDEDDDFFLRGPSSKKSVRFSGDKVQDVELEIASVTDVMRTNVGFLLERGQRLEDLHARSEGLNATSEEFRSASKRMRRTLWWQNTRARVGIGVGVAVLALMVAVPLLVKYL